MTFGPWITPPLDHFIHGDSTGGSTSITPFGTIGYRDFGVIREIPYAPSIGDPPFPPRATAIEYRDAHGTDPPGGPRFDVIMYADDRNIGSQTGTIDAHFPGGLNVLKAEIRTSGELADLHLDPTLVIGSVFVPVGAFTETVVWSSPVTTAAYTVETERFPLIPLLGYDGLFLDCRWVYQPSDYRFLYPGAPPLHQRQRTDGLGGGPPHHGPGLNSRQLSAFQRGML